MPALSHFLNSLVFMKRDDTIVHVGARSHLGVGMRKPLLFLLALLSGAPCRAADEATRYFKMVYDAVHPVVEVFEQHRLANVLNQLNIVSIFNFFDQEVSITDEKNQEHRVYLASPEELRKLLGTDATVQLKRNKKSIFSYQNESDLTVRIAGVKKKYEQISDVNYKRERIFEASDFSPALERLARCIQAYLEKQNKTVPLSYCYYGVELTLEEQIKNAMICNDRDGALIARAMHGALISQSKGVEVTDSQFAKQIDEDRIKGALACAAGTPVTILENHLLDHQFLERNDSEFFKKLMLVRPEAATSTMGSYVQQYLKPAALLTRELLERDPKTIQTIKRRPSASRFRDIPEEVIDVCVQERQKAIQAASGFLARNWKKFQEIHQGSNHDGARAFSCYLVSGTPHYVWDASKKGDAKRMVSKMCYFTGITPKGINHQLELTESYLQSIGAKEVLVNGVWESCPEGNIHDFFPDPDERFLNGFPLPVRVQLCVNLMTLTNKIWQYMKGNEQDKRSAANNEIEKYYEMPTNDTKLKKLLKSKMEEIFNPYWPISFNRYNGTDHFIRCGIWGVVGLEDYKRKGCFRYPNPLTFEVYYREATQQDITKDPLVYRPAQIMEHDSVEQNVGLSAQDPFEELGLSDLYQTWQRGKILSKSDVRTRLKNFLDQERSRNDKDKMRSLSIELLGYRHIFDIGEQQQVTLREWTDLGKEFDKAGRTD